MEIVPIEFLWQQAQDYERVEKAIQFIEATYPNQPTLKEIAASVHLSEFHFQRLFTRWVGISPKRFLQYLTKEQAKYLLLRSHSLLEATYETGLSSPGRLHDLFIHCEAVTPAEFKRRGAGLSIVYGFHPTPFGECLLALTERGICDLIFVLDHNHSGAIATLRQRWGQACLIQDERRTTPLANALFARLHAATTSPLSLHLRGTNFQIKVWEALLRIPAGTVVSYQDIAISIGLPQAVRAVAQAIAHNPIPVLIPCHRVLPKAGDFGGYRWGTARKKALLGWEMSLSEREKRV